MRPRVLVTLMALAGAVASFPIGTARGDDPSTIALSKHPQLFLDDYLIAQTTNLDRRLETPVRHPANPVIRQDFPWERRMLVLAGTVLYDQHRQVFRCWYLGNEFPTDVPDTPEGPAMAEYYLCYAESPDGIHWEKPLIGFDRFGRHRKTNVILNSAGFCVMPTPDDPDPNKKFKGAGAGVFGFSPDGIHWTTHKWKAVGKNDTSTSVVFWKGEYLAYVRNQEKDDRPKSNLQRAVGLSISKDFQTWTPKKTIFMTDEQDGYPWVQPYALAATPYGDQLIGLLYVIDLDREDGNNMRGDTRVQMVVSRDGRHWDRVANRAVFLEGNKSAWDKYTTFPATSVVSKDDTMYIYYTGTGSRHGEKRVHHNMGIGLVTLPADRFVAVVPQKAAKPAILQTKPFTFPGNTLLVNAALPGDTLRLELLDPQGNVLPGYDRDHCRLVRHDALRFRVGWADDAPGPTSTKALPRQAIALRFILDDGALYAFQILD